MPEQLTITCPRNSDHKLFRVNVPTMTSCVYNDRGNFVKREAILGPINEPGVNDEWHCCECEEPATAILEPTDG